jgi:iron complex outermembrane receptor protein
LPLQQFALKRFYKFILRLLTCRTALLCLVCIASLKTIAAPTKHQFDIQAQRADLALTMFAQQANTTLLFPFEQAQKETTNALNGTYAIELGLVKLLEGTGLYPIADESGSFTVRAIVTDELKPNDSETDQPVNPTDSPLSTNPTEYAIEKIAVVGTRSSPRSVIGSSVPLDIISAQELKRQGSSDMLSMLSALVPSLNVNDQPINDAASLVRPANLRGMASDHTLVLVNGKRRHRSAVITFLGGGLSDGAQGPDISNIPVSSIKQIEVLRDGAAAQYGSDAIAGVINFVLKDESEGGSLEARYGKHYAGDGEMQQLQANAGFSMFSKGFLNLSAEYKQQTATDRSTQRKDAFDLAAGGNRFISEPAQIWGTPKLNYDYKLSANIGYSLGSQADFYLFTNLAQRDIVGGFYFRNPQTRKGVYDGGLDENQVPLLLVGDLDGLNVGIECPAVQIVDNNVLDDDDYQVIANNNTDVGRNCFAFNEILPGGFTPKFGGKLSDAAFAMGTSGETLNEWLYDVSVSLGYSKVEYSIFDTINPSLGPNTPNSFSPGNAIQLEKNVNLDLSKQFTIGLAEPVNLAMGFEWRRENFKQQQGDPASYAVGTLGYNESTGLSQGFGIGSNGFPGFKPEVSGNWGRGNWALYVDAESQVNASLLLGFAVRHEDFTDFGSTLDGKFSLRYKLFDDVALRGSVSSGFKAPTVGQSNVINVTTAFASGGLEDQATLPPTNPISIQLGATALNPEQSINKSIGFVGKFSQSIFVTLDYFNIQLFDRISTTSALPLTQKDIDELLQQGVRDATSFSSAKYFTNDFDTTTQGFDLVFNYQFDLFGADSKIVLAYNWTDTVIDRVTQYDRTEANGTMFQESNLTPQRVRMIEDNLPAHRATVTFDQGFNQFQYFLRLSYFGGYYEDHLDASAGLDINAGSEYLIDFEVAYSFDESSKLAFGVKNLLDNQPDINPFADTVGAKYPPTSPMGINGGFYYLRASYNF